jgi:teichuronic acid biosynthesis glycosyltransferase TuaG
MEQNENQTKNIKQYNNDLVSVITSVYNAGHFLAKTIESIIAQTYPNMEFVLVNDCSTDNSAEIIEEYQKRYPNIIYHFQAKNMGAGVTRNTALELAKGRYVAFLDSDDIWKPEKTVRQLELMRQKNSPMSYTAIEMIDKTGKVVKSKRPVKNSIDYKLLLHNTMIATSTVIIDRAVMGDFRMPIRRGGQDYATWLKLLRNGVVAVGINEALVQYRVSSGSLSANKLKSIKQVWEMQTQDEKIRRLPAAWHVICFSFNALKKYLG